MRRCLRLTAAEQQITEPGLAFRIEADDLTIEHAATTFQIAKTGEALERASVTRDEPHATCIGVQQRAEPSHWISKSQSGWENGAPTRLSGNRWNRGRGSCFQYSCQPFSPKQKD